MNITNAVKAVAFAIVIAVTMAGTGHPQEGDPLAGTLLGTVLDDRFGSPRPVTLPSDDSAHQGYFIEWWQWWLHLETQDGSRIGATVTFFHFPLTALLPSAGAGLRRTDFRVTDVSDGSVHTGSTYSTEPMKFVPNGFEMATAGQRATGGDGRDSLHIEVDGYRLDLQVEAQRAPVLFFNPNGFFRLDPTETVRVYERQRMKAEGSLEKNGATMPLAGTAWAEHGWGNVPNVATIQWDFFQLELDDGRDIELAQVRRHAGGPVFTYQGQIRDPNGGTTYLHEGDFEIVPTGTWSRDATCTYPSGWRLRVKDDDLTVTPTLEDQEIRGQGYGNLWDGNTVVTGSVTGRGITELLNYCFTPKIAD